MRRMLHRCNTAVQGTSAGEYVYAPSIALELEHQLEEWYRCLPEMIRFEKGDMTQSLELIKIPPCPLSNFLRVQYYCCKLSIYWPAVYQAMQDRAVSDHLPDHCRRFFDSYVMLTPSIVAAFGNCHVNRWTLFVRLVENISKSGVIALLILGDSIFITSVAAITAGNIPYLSELCSPQFHQCIQESGRVDKTILQQSPSLIMLQEVLEERLSEASL